MNKDWMIHKFPKKLVVQIKKIALEKDSTLKKEVEKALIEYIKKEGNKNL